MEETNLLKANLALRIFSFLKIPLLGYVRPRIRHMDEKTTILRVPLTRRSKNHLNVMYFGALAMGAEAAVAARAFEEIRRKYRAERDFNQTVDRYIAEFERLLNEVSRDERGQAVARTYLTSETGKVYTMLAHAAGRFD